MNKSSFFVRSTRPSLLAFLCLCSVAAFTFGCEGHDTVGGKIADEVSGKDKSSSKNISGTWTGTSGSGQSGTVVTVHDNNGAISGSLRWDWGGVRSFSGSRNGNSVQWTTVHSGYTDTDTWTMTLSSNGKRLTGHASKSDGGGYAISLSR